ncbi:protein-tyrosine phosphatase [Paraburkholderia sp. BL6669N2]|uniref:arsenate reductase/protein-tyrosine-phosphatase family protein n=1 Tax=Paraburkholderia sp. BL6669N2 TaxID=1938807 RepID=UPI000E23F79F|nr:low molecular weight phosphotyrosine protein phosphatase [Paraburkholderia sp. BL6669N2]REG50341.1 protein-tyrosine phosphatase [Paraburkholderia sp. BL6669N2]
MISNVLTVCHGNLCRSPMAAALLQHRLPDVHVRSAGLAAVSGQRAETKAIAALSEIDIDIRAHRAMQLTREIANEAQLILTMTATQKRSVESLYPLMRGRVFSIRDFDNSDIDDPMGLSITAFRICRDALVDGVDHWVRKLAKLTERSNGGGFDAVSIGGGKQ